MIQIAAYRGTSFISRLIRWQTRSVYSHIALRFTEALRVRVPLQYGHARFVSIAADEVIEAWKGGVRKAANLSAAHTPGTRVDLFSFKVPLTEVETMTVAQFACAQLGKPYDYGAIIRFLTREPEDHWHKDKLFCSELAFEACLTAGRNLLERCAAWEMPPRDLPRSPLLALEGSVVTK
jgi:uncharacterized protein YycO